MSASNSSETVLLLPAVWAKGPSYVTTSYLGEDTPAVLARIGIVHESWADQSLADDEELLYGSAPTAGSSATQSPA